MNSDTLKLKIVQKILNLSDSNLLKQIENLLHEEIIVGFDSDGSPVSKSEYLQDMDEVDRQIKKGTLQTFTAEEAREKILGRKK